MKIFLSLLAVLLLAGCATQGDQTAPAGTAAYHYKKTTKSGSCEMTITSARDIAGITATVDRNCAVTISAEKLTGEQMQIQMMNLLGHAIDKLP